jgi:hypothetical protein
MGAEEAMAMRRPCGAISAASVLVHQLPITLLMGVMMMSPAVDQRTGGS